MHEQDVFPLAQRLDAVVAAAIDGDDTMDHELHGSELRNAKPAPRKARSASRWASIPRTIRLDLLVSAYREIAEYEPKDASFPVALFGVAVERRFRASLPMIQRERFAYEVLLNKFDVMLKRVRRRIDSTRGLVIHDRRAVAERDIQDWTRQWQHTADTFPQLRNLADVPLFGDSRASRLLQAADLVSYALYRHYDPARTGADYVDVLWPRFDAVDGAMHGCVHFTPSFGTHSCRCLPCTTRCAGAPLFAALRSIPAVGHEWDADPARWVREQRAGLRGPGGC